MVSAPRLLIAGVGNMFLGDDAFGVEVAQRMAQRPLLSDVRVIDFGIRGLELAYSLLDDGYEMVILVDAVRRGGDPGTLYVIEPEISESTDQYAPKRHDPVALALDAHHIDPVNVLELVSAMGGALERILLVGCEPTPAASYEEMAVGLSAPVRGAVEEAVALIEAQVRQMLSETSRANCNPEKEMNTR